MKQPQTNHQPAPPQEKMMSISFLLDAQVLEKLQDHIDHSKIFMRKRGIKFTKQSMYEFIISSGIKAYTEKAFEDWLQRKGLGNSVYVRKDVLK